MFHFILIIQTFSGKNFQKKKKKKVKDLKKPQKKVKDVELNIQKEIKNISLEKFGYQALVQNINGKTATIDFLPKEIV